MRADMLGEAAVCPILFISRLEVERDVLEEAGGDLVLLQALRDARRAAGIMVARIVRTRLVGAGAKRYIRHNLSSKVK